MSVDDTIKLNISIILCKENTKNNITVWSSSPLSEKNTSKNSTSI